jgi:hypothetical protein
MHEATHIRTSSSEVKNEAILCLHSPVGVHSPRQINIVWWRLVLVNVDLYSRYLSGALNFEVVPRYWDVCFGIRRQEVHPDGISVSV